MKLTTVIFYEKTVQEPEFLVESLGELGYVETVECSAITVKIELFFHCFLSTICVLTISFID